MFTIYLLMRWLITNYYNQTSMLVDINERMDWGG